MSPFALDSTVQMGLAELREIWHVPVSTGSPPLKSMVLGVISLKLGSQKRGQKWTPRNTVLRFTLKIRGSAPVAILGVVEFRGLSVNIGLGALGRVLGA